MPLALRLESKSPKEQMRFRTVLFRLCQAKRHERIEDKVLDVGIALEMLLLAHNPDHNQLSLMFRLRGAWLLAGSKEERLPLCTTFKKIYSERSSVAHTGTLRDAEEARRELPKWLDLASQTFRKLLEIEPKSWDDLILGI